MKSVLLSPNLRYIPLNDTEGSFGIFVVSDGDRYRYSITVNDEDEFKAALESFQSKPA